MYLTLDDAKRHLRLDHDEDDLYVQQLIQVAEFAIESHIGSTLQNIVSCSSLQPTEGGSFYHSGSAELPADIQHCIRLLVSQWYENREPVITGTITATLPFGIDYLLSTYKVWNIG